MGSSGEVVYIISLKVSLKIYAEKSIWFCIFAYQASSWFLLCQIRKKPLCVSLNQLLN